MSNPHAPRRAFLQLLLAGGLSSSRVLSGQIAAPAPVPSAPGGGPTLRDGAYHVLPGGSIQAALDAAAADAAHKIVRVHEGTYRPAARGQAMIWFNARHDGITLEAVGDVTLTAANPDLADAWAPSFPAVVNHVVYFGHGTSPATVLRGFRITGAKGFTTGAGQRSPIESDDVRKTLYFYADGGGIKIYARAHPTVEHCEIVENYTSPCGAGVSVEHLGQTQEAATFRHCTFRDNRTQVTGSALDVLHNSRATVENCLFVGNVANLGVDYVGLLTGGEFHPEHGSGALTVFQGARVDLNRCTFTDNWNGVDDNGSGSRYVDCIFWRNTRRGGISPGARYELDLVDGSGVRGSFIHGETNDLRGAIDRAANTFDPPDPQFDARYVPRAAPYARAGWRPVARS